MSSLTPFPAGIRVYLDQFVIRERRLAVVRAAGVAVSLFLAWLVTWCVLDRFLHLSAVVRLSGLAAGALLAISRLARPMANLHRQPDWLAAATRIEARNPSFAQRLVTVTSRLAGPSEYRGSDEILLRLVREVDERASLDRASRLVSLRRASAPWTLCLVLVLSILAFLRMQPPFRALVLRCLSPWIDRPPVTTTQLQVSPGDRDLAQSQPLTIEVQAEELGDSPVMLYLSNDARAWSHVAMARTGPGRFTFTLASADRDLRYYATGGDAVSRQFSLRILRRPSVAQFRIRYEYPSYTHLAAGTVYNTDGKIEAPAGTKVTLTATATEPLDAALLTIGAEKLLLHRTSDPFSRAIDLIVRKDSKYDLDLISAREVAGSGPSGMEIRAILDLPPQVRLLHGGETLRLLADAQVPLSYEAFDDYGLQSLVVRVQVNGGEVADAPLRIWDDPRQEQDVMNFDLAALPLQIGDVVKLWIVATDSTAHQSASEPLSVLIAPRPVDLDSYERIGELQNAGQLSQLLSAQLDESAKAQDEAEGQTDHLSAASMSARARGDRSLSAASQTAVLLRQSLLRAILHCPAPRSFAVLEGCVDGAEAESAAAENAFRQSGAASGMGNAARDSLHRAADQGRLIEQRLVLLTQAELARVIVADRENIAAAKSRGLSADEGAKRGMHQLLDRMQQAIAKDAAQLGLDPNAPDLEHQLQAKVTSADVVLNEARAVDFATAAREWSEQIKFDPQQRLGLEGRLWAGAQAEALRPDANLRRAGDLELAARAASAVSSAARASGRVVHPEALDKFALDVAAILRLRDLETVPEKQVSTGEVQAAQVAAGKARQDMRDWASDPDGASQPPPSSTQSFPASSTGDRQRGAETLALEASAAAADRDYQRAESLDEALNQRLLARSRRESPTGSITAGAEQDVVVPRERAEHHRQTLRRYMNEARRLDMLSQHQAVVTDRSSSTTAPSDLAAQQQRIAEQLTLASREQSADTSGPSRGASRRQDAMEAILTTEQKFATLHQGLAGPQAASGSRRDASAVAAKALDDALAPFATQTKSARAALSSQLIPCLQALEQALAGNDPGAVERSAAEARHAVETCQHELTLVQEELQRQDPLAAATWFATTAVQSLSLHPPDLDRARAQQASVSAALSRAWDQSIHRAAAERLAMLPTLAAVLNPPAQQTKDSLAARRPAKFSVAREWGRLRPREGPDFNTALHQSDPPGYEEALKIYFEGLGKAQGAK